MSEFFEPLWDFLFNEWGTFGLVIASSIPTFLILMTIGIVWLVRKLFRKFKKTTPAPVVSPAPKAVATQKKESPSAPNEVAPVKKEVTSAPKAAVPVKKAPAPKPAITVPDLKPELLYQKAGMLLHQSPDNGAEALAYYKAAAEKAYPPAQFAIAKLHLEGGATLSPNEAEGIRWMTQAAENSHAPAQLFLGQYYLERKDAEAANRWLKQAAQNGSTEAAKLLK